MKKHKFKVGDFVYCLSSTSGFIKEFIYCKQKKGSPSIHLWENQGDSQTCIWHFSPNDVHPTPEACAQALVDEFYINNPKAP